MKFGNGSIYSKNVIFIYNVAADKIAKLHKGAYFGTSDVFTNQLVPLAKSLTGSLSPWEGLSKEHVQGLVDKIYGSAQYIVQDAPMDPWGPLVSVLFVNCLGPC